MNGPQPAVKLQVKKEGPNQRRFFYVCRELKDIGAIPGQCGFFLWEDAAELREREAALRPVQRSVQRSEYVADSREYMSRLPWFPPYGEGWGFADCPYPDCKYCRDPTPVDDDVDSVKVKEEDMDDQASGLSAMKAPGMRKRPAAAAATVEDEEEEEYGTLESDVERQLVEIVDSSPLRPGQQRQQDHRGNNAPVPAPALSQAQMSNTTRTAMQHQHPGTRTPNPQRKYDASASMLTPTSRGNSTTAASESSATKRVKFSDPRGPSTNTRATTSTTPSQTQGRSLQTTPAGGISRPITTTTGPGPGEDYEITTSILSLLANEKGVADTTRQVIRDKLNMYALRMRGVERGRDMTRAALKAKEAKEEELRARIEELERERKSAADKIRALRDGLGEVLGDVDGGGSNDNGGGVERSGMGTRVDGWKF